MKRSFNWLANNVLGGSDNLEGEEVDQRLKCSSEAKNSNGKLFAKKPQGEENYAKGEQKKLE